MKRIPFLRARNPFSAFAESNSPVKVKEIIISRENRMVRHTFV